MRNSASDANRRGAFVLGALLVAIVAVAIAISFRIYTQLDSAVRVERALIAAQQDLDAVVEAQVALQNLLRGYVATGDPEFLTQFDAYEQSFDGGLADFESSTKALNVERVGSTIAEMHELHAAWTSEVKTPLLRARHGKSVKTRVTLGNIFVDQLRGDTRRVRALLVQGLDEVQAELKLRIDEALLGGIGSIVVFGAISIAFVTARVQLQDEIDRERNIVETLQGAFRDEPDVLPGARVGTAYLSAERDGAVGGDLYDVRRLDERRGLVLVADVSGKGIPAAVNTAFVRYSIGALARQTDDPAVVLAEFNRMFLASVSDPNLFVVVFAGILDGAGMTLRYASAGHSGAFLRRHGDVAQLAVTGPMIGLDATFAFESRTVALEAGDTIVLATDGLSEARDRDGAFLGDEGAMAFLAASTETSPERLAGDFVAHVRGRSDGRLADDLALLVLAIDGVS